jgi:hypothetical protein
MKPVEFRRLMTAGKRTVYNKGDVLIQSGEYHSRLHLLKRGIGYDCYWHLHMNR